MKSGKVWLVLFLLLSFSRIQAQDEEEKRTTFKFGGYIKADFLHTWYNNGDVGGTSALRDFHLPSQIPIGPKDRNYDLDYHVKESRFNFDARTKLLGKEIHGFVELDFLLSGSGDEKVSNSFNPRLRHFYFEWNRLLIGQTWSTFMVVVVPDEIDFSGALDGLIFIRQPQIRYKYKDWWFALENPETTVYNFGAPDVRVTDSEIVPDIIVRRNFKGEWGNWAIAGMLRTLHSRDSLRESASAFGVTTGGKLLVGKKGNDLRIMLSGGTGLGRYQAAGFVSGAAADQTGALNPIPTFNGYIAYNHFWMEGKLSSSFSISGFQAFHDNDFTSIEVNRRAYSLSGNIKYDPLPELRFGLEYMYAYRSIENGTDGSFHRLQLAAKYTFGYHNEEANEKR